MKREFVMTEWFDLSWKDLSLGDGELRSLQGELLREPAIGAVMQGTGGFRKMRSGIDGHGKSGGIRVVYLDIPTHETLYLMLVYPKNEKDNLTPAERNELKAIAANIKQNLRTQKRR
jgi:hypothetical protein